MKINNNSKYIFYIILFIIFILVRVIYVLQTGEIEEISFKSLAISRATFPFGIIKETALYDTFLPFYYFIIAILRHELIIKIFNSLIALLNIFMFYSIGKKLINKKLGIFLALFLTLNHFFLYYTNLIAPYCLIFLIQTCIVSYLLDFIKKPDKKSFIWLNVFNCLLTIVDTFGFLYVLCELFVLYLLSEKRKKLKKLTLKLFNNFFIAFLIVFPLLIVQYSQNIKLIIPSSNHIGFNLSGLYLMLSEYFSPYISFNAPDFQTKTTLGMLYSFFLNPDFKNINSIKIIITLFYGSILPLIIVALMLIKAYYKNYHLRLIWLISLINFGIFLVLIMLEKLPLEPILMTSFFISSVTLLGYGIFKIKDKIIKSILIFVILTIQLINPEISSFKITVNESFATVNPIAYFFKNNDITSNDLIIMPYMGHFGKLYYKQLNFFNFDYSYLQTSKKDGFIKKLSNKKAKTINKNNVFYLMKDFLIEQQINDYLMKYFIDNLNIEIESNNRVVLIIDKLNSKPLSKKAILKFINSNDYTSHLRKLNIRYSDLSQNQSKMLYDTLKSKTLHNFLSILSSNYILTSIVEYKKIDNEYYEIESSNNPFKALTSPNSDYLFLIYETP